MSTKPYKNRAKDTTHVWMFNSKLHIQRKFKGGGEAVIVLAKEEARALAKEMELWMVDNAWV